MNAFSLDVPVELMRLLSAEQAHFYRILPKEKRRDQLTFWTDQKQLQSTLPEELELLFGNTVCLEDAGAASIDAALLRYFPLKGNLSRQPESAVGVTEGSGDNFLWQLISEARQLGSSDIHLEAYPERCRVRIRVDGKLLERYQISKSDYPAIINQVKISSNLDIAEKRLPQDGRIFHNRGEKRFDIRVSVLPTLHGEKVVMRLLSQDANKIDLETLGFLPEDLNRYLEGVKRPTGILLISGPTGSGKTTTLYATLKVLNQISRNILTIEDPIEYTLEGINQVQLKESIGLGFPQTLRTFLRQDPDVIMVGEIRDADTAQMAVRLALTGHLVLSTIHTNSAWGTVSRLIDMGIPPFLVAATLHTSVAQRLVRLLCPACKQQTSLALNAFPPGFKPPLEVPFQYIAKGCPTCHYTGYRGRRALYEVIALDAELSRSIKEEQLDVGPLLQAKGISTLSERAFALFNAGETSLEEIYPLLYAF